MISCWIGDVKFAWARSETAAAAAGKQQKFAETAARGSMRRHAAAGSAARFNCFVWTSSSCRQRPEVAWAVRLTSCIVRFRYNYSSCCLAPIPRGPHQKHVRCHSFRARSPGRASCHVDRRPASPIAQFIVAAPRPAPSSTGRCRTLLF